MQNKTIRQPLDRTTEQFDNMDMQIAKLKYDPKPPGELEKRDYTEDIFKIEKKKKDIGKEISDYIRNKAREELSGPEYSHLPKDDASIQKALPELNRFDDRSGKSIDMDKKQEAFKDALDRTKAKDQSREQNPQPPKIKTKGHDRDER